MKVRQGRPDSMKPQSGRQPRDYKKREEPAAERIYGLNPVTEALKAARRPVFELWMVPWERNPRLVGIRELAGDIAVHPTTSKELDQKCRGGRHQGVLARVGPFPWSDLQALVTGDGPLLILSGIQDPQNLGAIIRSAAILEAAGIVLEKRRSAPLSSVVAKAASGALEHVKIARITNLHRAVTEIKKLGRWIVGTKESVGRPLWEADLPDRVAVVIGGEGEGIKRIIENSCDFWVNIPTSGPMNTFNASVASALILYELMRRKKVLDRNTDRQ